MLPYYLASLIIFHFLCASVSVNYVFAQMIDETNHPVPIIESKNEIMDLIMEIDIENEESSKR
jgi:hypothetical protein